MTSPGIEVWRALRRPFGEWRRRARRAIRDAVDAAPAVTAGELLALVDRAYPFGERERHPYKAWLTERRLLIAAISAPVPHPDEAAACEVASHLVELGREDEARALLDEQAPNRLAWRCPACNVGAGRPCLEPGEFTPQAFWAGPIMRERIVPHAARLGDV